ERMAGGVVFAERIEGTDKPHGLVRVVEYQPDRLAALRDVSRGGLVELLRQRREYRRRHQIARALGERDPIRRGWLVVVRVDKRDDPEPGNESRDKDSPEHGLFHKHDGSPFIPLLHLCGKRPANSLPATS